ncbi:Hypothetical predicted protein [Pelobates cultripes]|uniref:Uncharacterized protein n=1 Tax=Pelobates cultripes TaxID=61616 RepID=A0AAD1R2U7_PELCU|nr:Hypothetical predicted protein [Pelobates cultripes]
MEESNISLDSAELDDKKDKDTVTVHQLQISLSDILSEIKKELATNSQEIRHEIKHEMNQLAAKMLKFKEQVTEMDFHVNKLKDDNGKLHQRLYEFDIKINYLEDRLRRKNVRFRNIEELGKQEDLEQSLKEYFTALDILFNIEEEIIERCHRLAKPQTIHADLPRDIIACFVFI